MDKNNRHDPYGSGNNLDGSPSVGDSNYSSENDFSGDNTDGGLIDAVVTTIGEFFAGLGNLFG